MKPTKQIFSLLALLIVSNSARAFQHPEHAELPDLDVRRSVAPPISKPSAAQEAARQRLHTRYGDVQVGWPTNAAGFVLQQNSDLATTNWVTIAAPPNVAGANYQTTLPLPTGNGFFRLVLP